MVNHHTTAVLHWKALLHCLLKLRLKLSKVKEAVRMRYYYSIISGMYWSFALSI